MTYRTMLHHKTEGKRIFELPDDAEQREYALEELAEDGWKERAVIRAELAEGAQNTAEPESTPAESTPEQPASEVQPKPTEDASLDSMDKNDLEAYARDRFGVDLDKRKSEKNLRAEIAKLESGE